MENKANFFRADKALELARQLEADYYTIEALSGGIPVRIGPDENVTVIIYD
ncbi:MAG: hypothetical protein M0022_06680 [Desulfobacteraceae bacterium]|nr:hypothetical protein [Desulfobacteraceae bacterium]